MDIGPFSLFDKDDREGWAQWDMAHQLAHHTQHIDLMKNDLQTPNPPLDFFADNKDWLQLHQDIHQAQYNTLVLHGLPDFSDVDWKNQSSFEDWHLNHSLVHKAINTILGIR